MAQQTTATRVELGSVSAEGVPAITVRLSGALLALAVAAVHVADQGSITALAMPGWIGWGYRFIEVGATATAALLLLPRSLWLVRDWMGWAAGAVLGAGPFIGYVLSRTVGLPGDRGDVGNWGYWVGTVSLFTEAALIILSLTMLIGYVSRRAQPGPR